MKLVLLILAALASAKKNSGRTRSPINRLNKIKKQAFVFLDSTFKERVADHWKPKFERFIEGTKRRAILCGIPAGRTKQHAELRQRMLLKNASNRWRIPPVVGKSAT
ncbi:unnamed protein product [Oikopleura dioica]|uniref:Uncharacterized protein n=1 Tax=Oikopleura dioica TaxID=34765 RepID=E4XIE4_OIKDI|nr:unnamed protein product [Oikopleura dioica]